jgi:hypothetical protein
MPKIELIKSTKLTGAGIKEHYFIRIDGSYLDNSISYTQEDAITMLAFVKKNIHVHDVEDVFILEEVIVPETNNDPKHF